MRIGVHRRAPTRVCVEAGILGASPQEAVVVIMLVVVRHLAVGPPTILAVVVSIAVHVIVRLVDACRPSILARRVVDLRLESASSSVLATRNDTRFLVLDHHPHADSARQAPEQENDNAKADGTFGDFALAFAAPSEHFTLAFVVGVLIIFRFSLLDTLRLPNTERDGGCEPEEGKEQVDTEVGVYVDEAPGTGPHGDHYLVDQGGDAKEALRKALARCLWRGQKAAHKGKVEAELAAMLAFLGEDGKGEAAGYEGEESLSGMEEGFGLLVVALLDAHGERGWVAERARLGQGRESGGYVQRARVVG